MAERLMTYQQVAEFFSVTPRTVRTWVDKGIIPVVKTPSGQPRVPSTAVNTKGADSSAP